MEECQKRGEWQGLPYSDQVNTKSLKYKLKKMRQQSSRTDRDSESTRVYRNPTKRRQDGQLIYRQQNDTGLAQK